MRIKTLLGLALLGLAAISCTSRNGSTLLALLQGGGDIRVCYLWGYQKDFESRESVTFGNYGDEVRGSMDLCYLEVEKDGQKNFYDWNGTQLPLSQEANLIRCEIGALGYFINSEVNPKVTYDYRLNVIFPDKIMVMYAFGDGISVFTDNSCHVIYDLNGELLWHCPEGWVVRDMKKNDDGNVTLTMTMYGDWRGEKGAQTTTISLPVDAQHSRFNYNIDEGYRLSPGNIQLVNNIPVTDLGLSALWTFGDNTALNSLLWDFKGYTWEDDSYLKEHGDMFCLPSKKEMKELISKCIWTRTANGDYIVTSPSTGNSIVLDGSNSYWTSTLKKNKKGVLEGVCLEFDRPKGNEVGLGTADRKDSLFVRLVTH